MGRMGRIGHMAGDGFDYEHEHELEKTVKVEMVGTAA